jgi:perosamine synthetase
MKAKDITRNLLPLTVKLVDAMQRLDEGVGGVLFCVDEMGVMKGMLTDGDIRRALLGGALMTDSVEKYMNRSFTRGSAGSDRSENVKLLGPSIRHVPLLDDTGRPVDMVSWAEMWRLPVTVPSLAGNEMKYVADCIETMWISSQGGYIDKFQNAFVDFIGGGRALCTSSGTTALHLALEALDIGPGDEVIVPDITFGASANVIIHTGGKPVFVDIDPVTWTMDPRGFEAAITARTKAVMPVHLYGHPCDMDAIMSIARKHGLKVVEDCAESLGAEYKGVKVGLIGDIGCFSFFANKVITTGEGGMVLSGDPALMERMAMLRDHGMSKERRYWHLEAGFNYRMTNLQAALGLAQMERIGDFLNQRRAVVECYDARLGLIGGIRTPPSVDWANNIHWLYSIEVDEERLGIDRDRLAIKLMEAGIETRPVFPPLHLQPAYGSGARGIHPVSERFADRGLSLPTSNGLSVEEASRVCTAIEHIVEHERSLRPHRY